MTQVKKVSPREGRRENAQLDRGGKGVERERERDTGRGETKSKERQRKTVFLKANTRYEKKRWERSQHFTGGNENG